MGAQARPKRRFKYVRGFVAGAVLAAMLPAPLPSPAAASAAPAPAQIDRLLAARIKHVFVIYQENRSFDSEFGTFPGANGVWSPSARAHGFRQIDPVTHRAVTPFRLTDPDVYYQSNDRRTQIPAMHDGKMDRFVAVQGSAVLHYEKNATPEQRFSVGAESMYHVDCEVIPYLWAYAKNFTLFDNFFQALRAPSTPSNVEIIAAQNGLTQYARHPEQRAAEEDDPGDPIFADLDPAFGPYEREPKHKQIDQTYANVLLTMQRKDVKAVKNDAHDVKEDKSVIEQLGGAAVPWRWYEEGYAGKNHTGLISHHLAPQYFGYVAQNRSMVSNMRDLMDFYRDVSHGRLPDRGVFYVKGGSHNVLGVRPANRDPFVQKQFLGDDDHPGYTDSQISEALVASAVSTIVHSKYWKDSAIIIAWDDLGGFWDHVPPHNFEMCPDGHPCGDGARVPAIVISPYGKSGVIVHDFNDQDSVIKFVETVFGLPTLASLPDEKPYLPMGPRDGNPLISNMRGAFDYDRLRGAKPPLSPEGAFFSWKTIRTIPAPESCSSIGVKPATPPPGVSESPPPGFNPRPFAPTPPPH